MMALRFQDYPQHVRQLAGAALAAADPGRAVRRYLRRRGPRSLAIGEQRYAPDQGRVFLVAVGKAAVPMGLAATEIIAGDLFAAVLITKQGDEAWRSAVAPFISPQTAFHLFTAGHPTPDQNSVWATSAVIELLAQTTADDLVLCLISGGASALLTHPLIPLPEWRQLTQILLASGCDIHELNLVRRALDRVKGGGLARLAAPAICASLILSDVVGNPLEIIGSGPTAPPPPGEDVAAAAATVLARYGVAEQVDTAVWRQISQALAAVRPGYVDRRRIYNLVIGDVRQAAQAALARAAQLGFVPHLLTTHLEGEAREVGRLAAALARDIQPGHCYILGGETTVTVRGDGQGGRNQEVALAAALALTGLPGIVVASVATDGEDGVTPAAGAMVTGQTVEDGRHYGLEAADFLRRNDSHTFFAQLDARRRQAATEQAADTLIQTGPTGTNVNDLLFIFAYPHDL
jgi:glycerate 2-kinase